MIATITGTGNGSAPVVNISFPYIDKTHVKATSGGVPVGLTWTSSSQVQFAANVPNGAPWKVYRETPTSPPVVSFTDGSLLTKANLDLDSDSHRYRDEELRDLLDGASSDNQTALNAEINARSALENRTVRSPAGEIMSVLASAAQRAGKLLGFSSNGDVSLTALSAVDYSTNQAKIADSRVILASYTGMAPSQTAILGEGDRAGIFRWDPSNLSSKVSLDPRQAVYIAPASDTTGASGAWVRVFSGPLSVRWFGAVGDGTTNDGAAFTAALAYARDTHQVAFTYGYGTTPIYVPPGRYYLGTTTLDFYGAIRLFGDVAGSGGASAVLIWADGTTGIRTQSGNTSGASGSGGSYLTSSGSIIERLGLQGGYSGTVSESHGIHVRAPVVVRDVIIYKFPGDGIYARTQIGGGGALEGQSNLSRFERVWLEQNRNGMYLEGADANAIVIDACSAMDNRGWGFWDNSFLGNFYRGCHTRTNASGAYKADRNQLNAACTFADCYSESDQPASVFAPRTLVTGGFHAAGASGGGGISAANDRLTVGNVQFNGTFNANAVTVSDITANSLTIPNKFSLDANGTIVSYGAGLSLNGTGATLNIAGTPVVGVRQGGTAADASDLASVITLANTLKSQLRAHGLIA